MLPSIRDLLFVGLGGFLGANVRYMLTAWAAVRFEKWFGLASLPYGTLFVNVTGSFLLAVFGVWFAHQARWSESVRLLIGTGFFGAYTTFSTYANESVGLMRGEHGAEGLVYILLSNGLCLLAVLLGLWLGERWW